MSISEIKDGVPDGFDNPTALPQTPEQAEQWQQANRSWWESHPMRYDFTEVVEVDYEKEKGSSTIGSGANDMWLWVKTRASLLGTSDLRESTINVDVVNDVVTLKGTVATAAQKAKAEQVAKDIDGVKSVKNELKVAPSDSVTNMSSNTNKK